MSPDLVMDTCLLAGEIMLKNGGETYRTEETMSWIAKAVSMDSVNSSATPTSIILSFRANGQDHTRMIRTPSRTINLSKVTLANDVSRHLFREILPSMKPTTCFSKSIRENRFTPNGCCIRRLALPAALLPCLRAVLGMICCPPHWRD